jgi:curved DNA-binding protein CbpA
MTDRDAYVVLNVQPDAHQLVIQAAYRVLASLHHPDHEGESAVANRQMAELNDAYAKLRTPDRRATYDQERRAGAAPASVMTPPVRAATSAEQARPGTIDFGRYRGWTIASVARQDPDYLRWLARHSSGVRFRREIKEALAAAPSGPAASDRVFGRR